VAALASVGGTRRRMSIRKNVGSNSVRPEERNERMRGCVAVAFGTPPDISVTKLSI